MLATGLTIITAAVRAILTSWVNHGASDQRVARRASVDETAVDLSLFTEQSYYALSRHDAARRADLSAYQA